MVTRMLLTALLAAFALSACLPPPEERDATQAPSGTGGGATTTSDDGALLCSNSGGTLFTISGNSGAVSNTITGETGAKVFVVGLPCRQGTVAADGSYSFTIAADDASAAGFGVGSSVIVIAWKVGTSFNSVVADAVVHTLTSGTNTVSGFDLQWAIANHVTVNTSDGSAVTGAIIVGVSDSASHGFDMIRFPGAGGATFDTNYLPEGTYTLAITTDAGDTHLRGLFFDGPGSGPDDWDTPTINL